MTINEAHKICREYYQLPNPGEDDDFMLTEALKSPASIGGEFVTNLTQWRETSPH